MRIKTPTLRFLPAAAANKAWAALASAVIVALAAAACSSGGSGTSQGVRILADDGLLLQGRLYGQGAVGVVLAHQLGGDQGQWSDFAENLAARGFTALTFDFRGNGRSPGDVEVGIADSDVAAALKFMRTQASVHPVILIGASMGGTAALKVASRESVLGVVALSAPGSIRGLAATSDVVRIEAPKLFIVAEGDSPEVEDAREMFDRSVEPKALEIVPGSDHGVRLLSGSQRERVRNAILDFLDANR